MTRPLSDEDRKMVEFLEVIESKKTFREAIKLSCSIAHKTDKEMFSSLGIPQSTWSSMFNSPNPETGRFHPVDVELVVPIMQITGNFIPAQWLASQCDSVLMPKPKTIHEQLKEERERNKRLQDEVERLKRKLDTAVNALKVVNDTDEEALPSPSLQAKFSY